jgi:hypothetical protein
MAGIIWVEDIAAQYWYFLECWICLCKASANSATFLWRQIWSSNPPRVKVLLSMAVPKAGGFTFRPGGGECVNEKGLVFFGVKWFYLIPGGVLVYLSMKEGSLFCFVVMRSTEPGCFRSCSWRLWKAFDEEGCMGLVPWRLDLCCIGMLQIMFLVSLECFGWGGVHGLGSMTFGLVLA